MRKILFFLLILFFSNAGISQNNWKSNIVVDNPLQTQKEKPTLKVYPNPSFGKNITLEINNYDISEIQLINIAGKKIYQKKFQLKERKIKLDIADFQNGIYLLRAKTSDNQIVVKKISISKK